MRILNLFHKLYDIVIFLILLTLVLIGVYMVCDVLYIRYTAAGEAIYAYRPSDDRPDAYRELSEECVGWITIDDTSVDYPIMQTKDNSKYLNTNPYGEYSLAGSIFLDWQCDALLHDPFSLIYGHHMANGYMFGALDLFYEEDYFMQHQTGTLTTPEGVFQIEVFAFACLNASVQEIFDPASQLDHYHFIKENAIYFVEPSDNTHVVALATCKDPGTTERTILFVSVLEMK